MNGSTLESPHWFEKTVEYAFVLRHAQSLTCAVPLDGNHERAADAIFAVENARWLLIEFKRKASDFSSEEDKFSCYDFAREALSAAGEKLHFFVYGTPHQSAQTLDLEAASYWQQERTLPIDALLKTQGTNEPGVFWSYLKMLVDEKKAERGNQGGGPDFSFVAAVTEEGRIQAIASLSEVLTPAPTDEPTLELRM